LGPVTDQIAEAPDLLALRRSDLLEHSLERLQVAVDVRNDRDQHLYSLTRAPPPCILRADARRSRGGRAAARAARATSQPRPGRRAAGRPISSRRLRSRPGWPAPPRPPSPPRLAAIRAAGGRRARSARWQSGRRLPPLPRCSSIRSSTNTSRCRKASCAPTYW